MITKEAVEAARETYAKYGQLGALRTTPMSFGCAEAMLTAAIAAMPVPAAKLEWVPIIADGRDIEAVTEFGKYTISVDSSFAGGTHYLWTPDQREYDDDHHSEHRGMTSARAAAQADYEARILSALTPAPDLAAENERMRAALTPSAETKAAYIGEFSFSLTATDENGDERSERITVPWTTVKDIMRAIRGYAALDDRT